MRYAYLAQWKSAKKKRRKTFSSISSVSTFSESYVGNHQKWFTIRRESSVGRMILVWNKYAESGNWQLACVRPWQADAERKNRTSYCGRLIQETQRIASYVVQSFAQHNFRLFTRSFAIKSVIRKFGINLVKWLEFTDHRCELTAELRIFRRFQINSELHTYLIRVPNRSLEFTNTTWIGCIDACLSQFIVRCQRKFSVQWDSSMLRKMEKFCFPWSPTLFRRVCRDEQWRTVAMRKKCNTFMRASKPESQCWKN